jgi:hypothetical protein
MKIFDYIFYRICDFYKRKNDSSAEFTASLIVSILQCFIIINFFIIVAIFWEYPIPANFSKFWILFLAVPVQVVNWSRYVKNKKYRLYRKTWKKETIQNRRKNGKLIVLYLIVSIFIPVIYGLIRHNIMVGKSFW